MAILSNFGQYQQSLQGIWNAFFCSGWKAFAIAGVSQDLLQRAEYHNYLFLPFTDVSNAEETYEGGRYMDLTTGDIQNNTVLLDFNKAYNPYCAYVSGKYNCPIPPKENALPVAIKAGEKAYQGSH